MVLWRTLLQSRLDETKAWMSVSAQENDKEGQRRAMFLRWKKAVLVAWLTWGRDERVGQKRCQGCDVGGK